MIPALRRYARALGATPTSPRSVQDTLVRALRFGKTVFSAATSGAGSTLS